MAGKLAVEKGFCRVAQGVVLPAWVSSSVKQQQVFLSMRLIVVDGSMAKGHVGGALCAT
jgi:hypothetical protein